VVEIGVSKGSLKINAELNWRLQNLSETKIEGVCARAMVAGSATPCQKPKLRVFVHLQGEV